MRTGDNERRISYEWPNRARVLVGIVILKHVEVTAITFFHNKETFIVFS